MFAEIVNTCLWSPISIHDRTRKCGLIIEVLSAVIILYRAGLFGKYGEQMRNLAHSQKQSKQAASKNSVRYDLADILRWTLR